MEAAPKFLEGEPPLQTLDFSLRAGLSSIGHRASEFRLRRGWHVKFQQLCATFRYANGCTHVCRASFLNRAIIEARRSSSSARRSRASSIVRVRGDQFRLDVAVDGVQVRANVLGNLAIA